MNSYMPRISLLQESQLGAHSPHSVLISLLRGGAAIEVAAAHLRSESFPGLRSLDDPSTWYLALAFCTGFAHQAVVVFFLISGWLVGGSLMNKLARPDAFKLYAIDRITRLWTVLLPTFLLMLAIGIVSGALDPRMADFSPENPYSVSVFAANLLGLQTFVVPQFGGNYPLWSLANETWYYVLFPLLLMCAGARRWQRRAWAGAGVTAIALLLPLPALLYFSIWLLGAGFSRVRIDCGRATRAALLVALAGISVYFRLTGQNDDQTITSYPQDLLISLFFLLLLSASIGTIDPSSSATARVKRIATFLSNFSFTLYVVHVPLIGLLRSAGSAWLGIARLNPSRLPDLAAYMGMLVFVLAFAYGFYRMFESRTGAVRRALKALLVKRQPAPQGAA